MIQSIQLVIRLLFYEHYTSWINSTTESMKIGIEITVHVYKTYGSETLRFVFLVDTVHTFMSELYHNDIRFDLKEAA